MNRRKTIPLSPPGAKKTFGQRLLSVINAPIQHIDDPLQLRNTRLLAGSLFTIIIIALVSTAFLLLRIPYTFIPLPLSVGFIFLVFGYLFSRTRFYRLATSLTMAAFPVSAVLMSLSYPDFESLFTPLLLILGLLIGSLFLNPKGMIWLMVGYLATLAFIYLVTGFGYTPLYSIINNLALFLIAGGLILASIFHRRRIEEFHQEHLRNEERRYRLLSQLTSDFAHIIEVTPEGERNPVWTSVDHTNISGYTDEEFFSMGGWKSMVHPDDIGITQQQHANLLAGSPDTSEFRFTRKDGQVRWLRNYGKPVMDDGRVRWIYSAIQDITERVQVEEALRKQNTMLVQLQESVNALTTTLETHHVAKIFSAEIVELLGVDNCRILEWQPGRKTFIELVGKDRSATDPTQSITNTYPVIYKIIDNQHPFQAQYSGTEDSSPLNQYFKSREIKSILALPLVSLSDSVGVALLEVKDSEREFTNQEISYGQVIASQAASALKNANFFRQTQEALQKRLRAEEALLNSEDRYRTLVEDMPVYISRFNADGTLTFANDHFINQFNSNETEIIGQSIFNLIPEADSQKLAVNLNQLTPEYPVSSIEHQVSAPDGAAQWQLWINRAIFDEQGKPVEYQTIGEDITERVISEEKTKDANIRLENALQRLEAAQNKMIAQERLAAVGQLSAGIAHDFNNALLSILLYTEMLQRKENISTDGKKWLEIVLNQANHAAKLTQQILDFSRRSILKKETLDLVEFFDDLHPFLKQTLPENIEVSVFYDSQSITIEGDSNRLKQVFVNLSINARDAMPDGGELRFTIAKERIDSGQSILSPDLEPGDFAKITVTDTGFGILAEDIPHIFEPFFTTKDVGKGSGLGLSQVYGIINQHNGHIDVESQSQSGTSFYIYLPLLQAEPALEEPYAAQIIEKPGRKTVLVVEDSRATRQALCDILEMLDYNTISARNGEEAITLFEQSQVDLVISDLVMPKMGGVDLAKSLQEINPEIKMVVLTGYPLSEAPDDLSKHGIIAFMQKPINIETISMIVKKAFEAV